MRRLLPSCTVGHAPRQRQSRAGAVALSRSGGKSSAGAPLRAHATRSEAMTAISTPRISESTVSADANEATTATARQPAAPASLLAADRYRIRRRASTTRPQHDRDMPVRPRRGSRSLRKRTREDGRCPARTGDLLLVRREQLLRSAAVCRSEPLGERCPAQLLRSAAVCRFQAASTSALQCRAMPPLSRKGSSKWITRSGRCAEGARA